MSTLEEQGEEREYIKNNAAAIAARRALMQKLKAADPYYRKHKESPSRKALDGKVILSTNLLLDTGLCSLLCYELQNNRRAI
jgi:hypothetical protein